MQLINKTETADNWASIERANRKQIRELGPGGTKNCEGGGNSAKRKLADTGLAVISPSLSGHLEVFLMERESQGDYELGIWKLQWAHLRTHKHWKMRWKYALKVSKTSPSSSLTLSILDTGCPGLYPWGIRLEDSFKTLALKSGLQTEDVVKSLHETKSFIITLTWFGG